MNSTNETAAEGSPGSCSVSVTARHRGRRGVMRDIPELQPPPDKGLQPPIPPRSRGSMHVIDQTYESLDYDTCANTLYQRERLNTSFMQAATHVFLRSVVAAGTGVLTAAVAVLIGVSIGNISGIKFGLIQPLLDQDHRAAGVFTWMSLNVLFVLPAIACGTFIEPVAAGSGIPQVKCYLNGVKVPRVVRIKTLVCKVLGVISSVAGGLLVGKEGPMIHSGAVVAAGISQGKSTTFGKDFNFFHRFREDHEKRDFVACGAAAGVSAAFGAPIGGVLFALEEGASHWQQGLTWTSFVSAGVASCTLNVLLSLIYDKSRGGLLDFGMFDNLTTTYLDVPVFLVMSIISGVMGALYNHINKKITVVRMRYITNKWLKLLEVCVVAALTALCACTLIWVYPDCKVAPGDMPSMYPVKGSCPAGQESMSARLFMATPESSLKNLFHDPYGTYGLPTLLIHFVTTYFLACYTYGLGVPSGLFIPTLLNGASFGRLCGVLVNDYLPLTSSLPPAEGKYALIGAAAFLGAVVRMTLSLTSILMESSGAVVFTVSLFFNIYIGKFVGDIFNKGLYDIHIRLTGVPFLEPSNEPLMENLYSNKLMSSPSICLRPVESVRRLLLIARHCTHNGFPVVCQDALRQRIELDESGKGRTNSKSSGDRKSSDVNTKESPRKGSVVDQDRKQFIGDNNDEHYDDIDRIMDIDAEILRQYFLKQNAEEGINSEEMRSHLLTDSCINRFSRDVLYISSEATSTDTARPVSIRIPSDSSDDTVEAASVISTDAEEVEGRSASQWYKDTQGISLDDDLGTLKEVQGTLCGLMLRSQIMVMLKHKMFIERSEYLSSNAWQDLRVFRDAYPRYYDLEAVDLLPEDLDCHVDLRPYMNPAPHVSSKNMSYPRAFAQFRSLGLRHLTVVGNKNEVMGIITRKDLIKFHAKRVNGEVRLSRMDVYEKVT